MSFRAAVNKKLNRSEGKRVVPTASSFVQALRAKAGEARSKLKPTPTGATPKGQKPSGAGGTARAKASPATKQAPQGPAGATAPARRAVKPASSSATVKPAAAARAPAASAAAPAAKDVREVASGPRGGKFVTSEAGTKHYVK